MRRSAAFLALSITLALSPPSQVATEADDDRLADFSQSLETLRRALAIPGMAAVVLDEGEVVFAEGFGHADLESGVEAVSTTPFGLASVTKPIAATLIMQLVEDGLIDLDAPISDYGVSIVGDRGITVRHLLTHTSEGTPGTVHEYNGDRYGFLGGVIQGATGQSFSELLGERILLPIGMTDTALNPLESWGGASSPLEDIQRAMGWGQAFVHYPDVYRRLSRPYQLTEDGETAPGMYHLHHNPAAGLVASVNDLARFDTALDSGALLSQEALSEMWTPAIPTVVGRSDLHYGLGWYVQEFEGTRLIWHSGRWPPSTSALYVKAPDLGLTFIIAANTDNLTVPFPGIGFGDLARSAPMLTFFHHFVFPRIHDHGLATVDWSASRAELLETLSAVERIEDRTMLERELWSYRQAFASSLQSIHADLLYEVAGTAFGRSQLAADSMYTSTTGPQPPVEPIVSAAGFRRITVGVVIWLSAVAIAAAWMATRLLRSGSRNVWDWGAWLVATALLGPLAPFVHSEVGRGRCRSVCASLLGVGGYAVAWTMAVGLIMRLAGEPSPIVVLAATVFLPFTVGLVLIRAPVLVRVGVPGYGTALRKGAVAEMIAWGVGLAAFLPLTFAVGTFLLGTIPPPSSPLFGAMMSLVSLVAVALLTGLHNVLRRRGFSIWPAAATVTGTREDVLVTPTVRTAGWWLVLAFGVAAAALASTVTFLG